MRRGDLTLPRFDLTAARNCCRRSMLWGEKGAASARSSGGVGKIVVHKEGAEVAAETARSLEMDESLHMICHAPFLFVLRDRDSDVILVAGYVGPPLLVERKKKEEDAAVLLPGVVL